ncbi:MAG: ATPase [Flavobacteriaceae bacterium]|nr:ATPase [Flavobacteriaceae bacterium]
MNPIYLDLHIHTSDDPNNLNPDYNLQLLIDNINNYTKNSTFLISITDHNTINKAVYLKAKDLGINILVGVELHIKNYSSCPPYHCHIYFNLDEINDTIIDELNAKLDKLYPNKVINKDDDSPRIETVINTFDLYEFLLLPHGGQSHSTFDKSIPDGVRFDSTMERSIYYNQFDGFTARGNSGLERTQDYFKKLGINEFVNLMTCTDNYNSSQYPNAKSSQAKPFVPTWMFSLPKFNGLRLSLSESSRLVYSVEKPKNWSENIRAIKLSKANIEIDVELTSGLNVVIGSSSSGKTLLVDSIHKKIYNDFSKTNYGHFEVDKIIVENPSGLYPHYISQNYIMSIVNETTDHNLGNIDIIKKVFPGDDTIREKVDAGLLKLKSDLKDLVKCVKIIEDQDKNLKKIPILSRLVNKQDVQKNIFSNLLPTQETIDKTEYSQHQYEQHTSVLDEIETFLLANPFIEHNDDLIADLKEELNKAFNVSQFENKTRKIIQHSKTDYDEHLRASNEEEQSKKQHFDTLVDSIKKYSKAYSRFKNIIEKISEYSIRCDSEVIESMGHKMYIQNHFSLTKEKFFEVINSHLKTDKKVICFNQLTPENLFLENFKKQSPKVHSYDDFEIKVNKKFEDLNKKKYKIETAEGRDFDNLSAGWKTSVILDIILGYDGDIAPIIIDQPEDNLATNYINNGLVKAIKKIKAKKQVIMVSHNATIPMLADAQNIVLCQNDGNKISIVSSRLEGQIAGKNVLDYIAEITDGGKPSIKKRVKKYNLKHFTE